MTAYYNEIDPYAAQWTRNLIAAGLVAPGDVDERSIADVAADDLRGYRQCHFFSGIAVWSYSLRLAGWDDARAVWTGSCPCQPFSVAGKRGGMADARHLWPDWFKLIAECRPGVVFGEQVSSKDAVSWIDAVFDDLEGEGYACGAVDFPACGVGAPNIRQRHFWMADAAGAGPLPGAHPGIHRGEESGGSRHGEPERLGPTGGFWRAADWLWCRDEKHRPVEPGTRPLAHGAAGRVGRLRAYGNAINAQVAAEVIGAYMEARP